MRTAAAWRCTHNNSRTAPGGFLADQAEISRSRLSAMSCELPVIQKLHFQSFQQLF
jgi:hypothetical protein